jgi:RND family efflux transporter MFP subunit
MAGVFLAALLLGACERPPPAAPAVPLVVSLAVHAAPPDAASTLRYPIEVAARYSNIMSFRVGGQIAERRVRLGDAVHKGDVLARLDPIDAQKQAASARAALDAAAHRFAFAKQQLDRDRAQSAQQLIAQNQLEQSEDAYSAAVAAQEQAADQLAVAQNTLHYNSLVADHNGVITSENADTGQVVSAGQAIYGLAWSDDIDVILNAAAGDLPRMTIGQPASVTFPTLPGRRYKARVREVSPAADPQSRTYLVKLTLLDPGREVRLGMTGDATLAGGAATVAAPNAALFEIPATALFHQGRDPAVWVIRGDSVLELRTVRVRTFTERAVYVDGGLQDGERIVAAGVHTVYPGEHVKAIAPLFADDLGAQP